MSESFDQVIARYPFGRVLFASGEPCSMEDGEIVTQGIRYEGRDSRGYPRYRVRAGRRIG